MFKNIRFSTANLASISREIQAIKTSSKTTRLFSNQYGPSLYSIRKKPNFISKVFYDIHEDIKKNKELQELLRKFRQETIDEFEQSAAIKSARKKYQLIGENELSKKTRQLNKKFKTTAKNTAEIISQKIRVFGETRTCQALIQTLDFLDKMVGSNDIRYRVYEPPIKLRKRTEIIDKNGKIYKANADATSVELHKDSKFYEQSQKLKNNSYFDKVLHWKIKYEESENLLIRALRLLTNTVTDFIGVVFRMLLDCFFGATDVSDLSETLSKICETNQSFNRNQFLIDCQTDIIPNILEAMVRGDLDILKDWCHGGPFNVIAEPLRQAKKSGYRFDSKILDIDNVKLTLGKVMEGQGPILFIYFKTQQIMCVRDANDKVVWGDPKKVEKIENLWALSYDKKELDPKSAWRLLEYNIDIQ